MTIQSYATLRREYGPHCTETSKVGAQEAWDAHQLVMRSVGYLLRQADTGSRNCRPVTGSDGKDPNDWSMHAFFLACVINLWNLVRRIPAAVACDFNWNSNPYGQRLVTDMPRAMVEAICAIRTNSGAQVFQWGGYYAGKKDAMHFEIVCLARDLATGINWSTVFGHPSHPATPPTTPPQPIDPDEEDDMRPRFIEKTVEPDGKPLNITLPPWDRDADYNFERCVFSASSDPGKYDPATRTPKPMDVRVAGLNAKGEVTVIKDGVTNSNLEKCRGISSPVEIPKGTRTVSVQNFGDATVGITLEFLL